MEIYEATAGDVTLNVADITCESCQRLVDQWTQCHARTEDIPIYPGIDQVEVFTRRIMVVDVSAGLHDRARWELKYLGASLRNGREGPGTMGAFQQWVRRCGGVGVANIILEAAQTGMPAAAATRLNVPIVALGTATLVAVPYRLQEGSRPETNAVLVAIVTPAFDLADTGTHHGKTVVYGPWPGNNGAPAADRSHLEQPSFRKRRE